MPGLVLPKASSSSIKIDTSSPTDGYKDLIGPIRPDPLGIGAPAYTMIRGTGTKIGAYAFAATDVIEDITFHIPHDYVSGSDIYLHVHWTHAGTSISGSLILDYYFTYCKGYNQSSQTFVAEKTVSQSISTPDVATYPQYGHFINEFQLSNAGGDSTHLDRGLLEPDGLLKVAMTVNTIPTIAGSPAGSSNDPFILYIDVHYQSTQLATKNKNYPFYT